MKCEICSRQLPGSFKCATCRFYKNFDFKKYIKELYKDFNRTYVEDFSIKYLKQVLLEQDVSFRYNLCSYFSYDLNKKQYKDIIDEIIKEINL